MPTSGDEPCSAGEAVGREPRRDAIPLDAGADPDAPRAGIDADLLERG